jgi:type IV secretory pathway VirB6-like protein
MEIVMTNSDYLIMAENRFASVQRYFPNSSEFNRLFNIILDMTNKMTDEERDQHNAKKIETPAAKAARLKEEQRSLERMAMNKDSASI